MTRFSITLDQGVDFVMECFGRMHGGEIFVPRLPSLRVKDVATALAPQLPIKIVGLRPGEKLHESLCPSDVSHSVIKFEKFFIIKPDITFTRPVDYTVTRLGERGEPVADGFEYRSDTNEWFLTPDQIRAQVSSAL